MPARTFTIMVRFPLFPPRGFPPRTVCFAAPSGRLSARAVFCPRRSNRQRLREQKNHSGRKGRRIPRLLTLQSNQVGPSLLPPTTRLDSASPRIVAAALMRLAVRKAVSPRGWKLTLESGPQVDYNDARRAIALIPRENAPAAVERRTFHRPLFCLSGGAPVNRFPHSLRSASVVVSAHVGVTRSSTIRALTLALTVFAAVFTAVCLSHPIAQAEDAAAVKTASSLPLVFADDFESGADHWQPLDPPHWKIAAGNGGHVFSHFVKQGKYKPPHRSPVNIALLKDHAVEDFEYTVKVKSTHPDYGHRDAVLVFGYQDPAHFYYVHFGKQTDDHANQIFLVNEKPRVKISTKTTSGTPWDDAWHTVRVSRRVADGSISVFYDDMEKPVMTAQDKTFTWGRVGLGSFDDTTEWDDVKLLGKRK